MRRSDGEIKEFDRIIEVMERCDAMRLAINDREFPYIIPLNFGMEADQDEKRVFLYFHGAAEGKKTDLLKENNKVSFEMDTAHKFVTDPDKGSCTMEYESVIGTGLAVPVGEEEKYEALCKILKHYKAGNFPFNQSVMERTGIYRIEVLSITGKERKKNTDAGGRWGCDLENMELRR